MIEIRVCPTCGSKRIRRVRSNWTGEVGGRDCVVQDLEFHECPACGERLYDHAAMQRIEQLARTRRRRSRSPS